MTKHRSSELHRTHQSSGWRIRAEACRSELGLSDSRSDLNMSKHRSSELQRTHQSSNERMRTRAGGSEQRLADPSSGWRISAEACRSELGLPDARSDLDMWKHRSSELHRTHQSPTGRMRTRAGGSEQRLADPSSGYPMPDQIST
ncbi:uncharacterized protein MONBRDRAFT_13222 [Monosiga brevicollis MX1]|uniref:Uncharacterized protein n=1 Tax=Monosiga brevicollis TaxID=81824 RepID=A9VEL9_MONBE|nr:uncharacterized protein MONBRDRAFT_13222 [Monosiga brevicollis MX1]EDQ84022.1 predicted protein [Monosiga brevicollis MX1]|eukprot:XP_001751166.1 hypothetical protein [Monosiga brevicollis MX1]